jgi:hypothetical protein
MSQENVDRFRKGIEAFDRMDIPALLEFLDPEIQFDHRLSELQGSYVGREGVQGFFVDAAEHFDAWRVECPDVRDLGDRVLAVLHLAFSGRRSLQRRRRSHGSRTTWHPTARPADTPGSPDSGSPSRSGTDLVRREQRPRAGQRPPHRPLGGSSRRRRSPARGDALELPALLWLRCCGRDRLPRPSHARARRAHSSAFSARPPPSPCGGRC